MVLWFASCADLFRVINLMLSVAVSLWLMFDKYSPWRNREPALHVLWFAIGGCFLWLGYIGFEVLILAPPGSPAAPEGLRVFGTTFWLVFAAVAMGVRHVQDFRADRARGKGRHAK